MQKELRPKTPMVSVVVVEANYLNCELISSAFRQRKYGVSVVGSAIHSSQAVQLLKELHPSVALISAELAEEEMEGFQLLRVTHDLELGTHPVLLMGKHDRDLIVEAFRRGAHGVVFRDEPLETLRKAIHAVHEGQIWADSENLQFVMEALARQIHVQNARVFDPLSRREEEVTRLVAEGLTNRQISKELKLSEHTVRNYMLRIFDKVGVSSRVELVLYCLQNRSQAPSREAC